MQVRICQFAKQFINSEIGGEFLVFDRDVCVLCVFVPATLVVTLDRFAGYLINELLPQPVAGLLVDLIATGAGGVTRGSLRQKAAPLGGSEPKIATPALTRGQMNAVRAAFKAGNTPPRISRQFGLTQADVRKALAADKI